LVLLSAIFFTLFGGNHIEGRALQGAGTSNGVDFFILIDQTNSMSINDSQKLRVDTAKYLVDYFAFYSANHPDEINRISIIDFGEATQATTLDSLPVTDAPDQDPGLNELKANIKAKGLGEANIINGFDVVDGELKSATNLGENRRKVLVLINDGNPVIERLVSSADLATNFGEVEKKYSLLKENYPGQWNMFVFGIYPQDAYWSKIVGPYWGKFSTSAVQIHQIEDMKTEVVREMGPTMGYTGHSYTARESFLVEPYVEYVRFSIFKYSPTTEITLGYQEKNGSVTTVDPNAENVKRLPSSNFETWTITNPTAGIWKIGTTSNGKLDIFVQNQPGPVSLTFPTSDRPLGIPFYFRLDMPQYMASNIKYPLTWNINLLDPNGSEIVLDISKNASGSIFQSSQAYLPTLTGNYKINIEVSTKYDDSSDAFVLYSGEYSFSVFDVKFRLDPTPPYLQYEPLSNLTLHLTDQNDVPIEVDPVATMNLSMRLHLPNGEVHTYPLDRINDVYRINQPILLNGDGQKSFEIIATDESNRELFVKSFPVETFMNIQLLDPQEQVPQNSSLSNLEIKLLDMNNLAFVPSNDFGLKLDITIIPSATENPVTGRLDFDPQKESFVGQFPSLPTKSIGKNIVKVVGVVTVDGKENQLFEKNIYYSVMTELPYFRVISPSVNKKEYPLYLGSQKVGVPIQIQWVKGDLPVDPTSEFINNPSDLVAVDILKDGKPVLTGVKLAQLSTSDSSTWGVTITDLSTAGNYTAVFTLQNAMLISQQPYMEFKPIEIQFILVEDALQRWFRISGIIVAALLVGILGGNEILERRGPFPRGSLTVIEHNVNADTKIGELNLANKKRRTVRWHLNDKKMQSLGIKKMIIRQVIGRRGAQTEGVIVDAFDDKGKRSFTMQFDRGASEKRIPRRGEQSQIYYGLAYTPPVAYTIKTLASHK